MKVYSLAILSVFLFLAQSAQAKSENSPPNVLFLMTDQQVWYALSVYDDYFNTPNLDRLARTGARFDFATCTTPSCTPARGSIVTGKYPHTTTITKNLREGKAADNYKGTLQHRIETTDHALTENILFEEGYVTAHCGKWHLGHKDAYPCYSKDTLLQGQSAQYQSRADYWKMLDEKYPLELFEEGDGMTWKRPVYFSDAFKMQVKDAKMKHKALVTGRTPIPEEMLIHTMITDETIRNIQARKGKNWMITASWHPPHIPWVMPEPWYSMYDRAKVKYTEDDPEVPEQFRKFNAPRLGKIMGEVGIREYLAVYAGQVAYIDKQVGRVLDALEESGQSENTLIIFTSDHGDMQGRFNSVGKSIDSFYDTLVRIPLIINYPGKIKPGTIIGEFVSQVDYMPTILDYCGVDIPSDIQGRSLRPLIEGEVERIREYAFCERVVQQKYAGRMIRSKDFKYCWYETGEQYFYDLKKDPEEKTDVFNDETYSDEIEKLHRELKRWMKETNDPAYTTVPDSPFKEEI
jgi:arylsulfatase A-like enzyme